MIHETEFIRSFVIATKKQRFLEFINSKKGREKFLAQLDHPNFILPESIIPIPSHRKTPELIGIMLKEHNAPDICFVISSNSDMDSKEFPLDRALKETVGRGCGTIISCIPGKLVFIEDEDGDSRFILKKSNS